MRLERHLWRLLLIFRIYMFSVYLRKNFSKRYGITNLKLRQFIWRRKLYLTNLQRYKWVLVALSFSQVAVNGRTRLWRNAKNDRLFKWKYQGRKELWKIRERKSWIVLEKTRIVEEFYWKGNKTRPQRLRIAQKSLLYAWRDFLSDFQTPWRREKWFNPFFFFSDLRLCNHY